jgi:hypothetical protein
MPADDLRRHRIVRAHRSACAIILQSLPQKARPCQTRPFLLQRTTSARRRVSRSSEDTSASPLDDDIVLPCAGCSIGDIIAHPSDSISTIATPHRASHLILYL